ncbi:MAG: bifunctional glutamate N-acetyltransferase/amino-acid acetyltransferase ArgJ [Deltaproteobacteria bacterium]|nr:bifunctional glutamate N-acetyltransferase/amino-acid acetyltransferase ArgJ [Deltaproteobacteria bacterium]
MEEVCDIGNIKFSAVSAGIKGEGLDLGLALFEIPFSFIGLYTRNRIKASHIHYAKKLEGRKIRALFVTSGCANAATGKEGIEDLKRLARMISERTSLKEDEILFASTGVIGKRLPIEKIADSIPFLVDNADPSKLEDFAYAMMTTDTYPKVLKRTFSGKKTYSILGVAKGAGMINPKLATMLCFLFTDYPGKREVLVNPFRAYCRESFEKITVDSETSTNDTVMLFFPEGEIDEKAYSIFTETLKDLMRELALLIVRDGEGATKVIHIKVNGAKTKMAAQEIARRIARSTLVKCAFFGNDPNWGRIIAAVGDTDITIRPERISIKIEGMEVAKGGVETPFDEDELKRKLTSKEVEVEIDLGLGKASYEIYTTDLTYDYVKINASYRS